MLLDQQLHISHVIEVPIFFSSELQGMVWQSQCEQISVYLIFKIHFIMFEKHFQIFEIQNEIIISENEF